MKSLLMMIVLGFSAQAAMAVEMKPVNCWQNKAACQGIKLDDYQDCTVCLMQAASKPTQVIQMFKGWKQSEQNANLAQCKTMKAYGQLCVTDWGVHKGAVYDVALMQ